MFHIISREKNNPFFADPLLACGLLARRNMEIAPLKILPATPAAIMGLTASNDSVE
jgi:hypothetical protein